MTASTVPIITGCEVPEPRHWPMPMARFGTTPAGKNLYRIVFASSVRMLVGGLWKDGKIEYRARPAYRHIGDEWILERWLSAQEFTGMTRDQYELRYRDPKTGLFTIGPYPEHGAYMMCLDAPLVPEAIPSIGKLIEGVEFGRRNRSIERTRENERLMAEDLARQTNAEDSLLLDKIKDTRPAFGNRPTSFKGHIKSQKSHRIVKSAQELGLPIGDNKFLQIKGK